MSPDRPPSATPHHPPSPVLRIGLTGGIGSGKTTIANLFARLGVEVIDTDAIAHALVEPGKPALARIVETFGKSVLESDGRLNRRRLGKLVFEDPGQRRRLEAILHPLIREEVSRRTAAVTTPYCLVVIPLLIETGFADRVDRILVIDAEEQEQIRRTMARSGLSETEVRRILSAQASRAERLAAADDVIRNDRDQRHLEEEVGRLHARYLAIAAAARR
jgi:dephospho-CoA kinase